MRRCKELAWHASATEFGFLHNVHDFLHIMRMQQKHSPSSVCCIILHQQNLLGAGFEVKLFREKHTEGR